MKRETKEEETEESEKFTWRLTGFSWFERNERRQEQNAQKRFSKVLSKETEKKFPVRVSVWIIIFFQYLKLRDKQQNNRHSRAEKSGEEGWNSYGKGRTEDADVRGGEKKERRKLKNARQ